MLDWRERMGQPDAPSRHELLMWALMHANTFAFAFALDHSQRMNFSRAIASASFSSVFFLLAT